MLLGRRGGSCGGGSGSGSASVEAFAALHAVQSLAVNSAALSVYQVAWYCWKKIFGLVLPGIGGIAQ